jgi:hypothetical protein
VKLLAALKTAVPPFFFLILLFVAFLNFRPGNAAITNFSWLKPGAYTLYPFEQAIFYFDDLGEADPVRGNYSWICLQRNSTHALLSVEVNIEVYQTPEMTSPGAVTYRGIEFLRRAQNGDLSFIRRVPMDQVVGRVRLDNFPGEGYYAVRIPSPIIISKNFTVTVDLDTMIMIDETGKCWGKWIMWINPFKYPLEGVTVEPFIMNWVNTTVDLNVTYAPDLSRPYETALGKMSRVFVASCFPPPSKGTSCQT